LLDSTKFWW